MAVTTDSWTSISNESYITVTCHFVTKDFELKSAVLSTKKKLCPKLENGKNHTSENLAAALSVILNDWNIETKLSCIVTDNAANMIKMAELMKKKHLPCFAHSMNLVVQECIELPPIKQILSKCKQIVTFVKSSNNAFEIIKKEQNTTTPYKLVQEVTTRWNSVFYMVSRILKTHEH